MGLFKDQIDRKRVTVDGQPFEVPDFVSPGALIRAAGHEPSTRSLVVADGHAQSMLVPPNRRIRTTRGQRFETTLNSRGG
jgi:hypothetical protein